MAGGGVRTRNGPGPAKNAPRVIPRGLRESVRDGPGGSPDYPKTARKRGANNVPITAKEGPRGPQDAQMWFRSHLAQTISSQA
eukprot:1223333-Pyramimonas_sp.AAC.1